MSYPGQVRSQVNPFLLQVKKTEFRSGQEILIRIAMSIYYTLYFYINNIFLFFFYYYFIKIIKYLLSHVSPLLPQTLHLSLFPNPQTHPSKSLPLSYPQPTSWILYISNPSSLSFLDPLSLSPLSLLNFLSSKTHTLTNFLWACFHSVTNHYTWRWW